LRTKRQIETAADNINRWRDRPDLMVRELWPGVVPDAWQAEVLRDFPVTKRQSMIACKSPGKTTVEVWLLINFMLTRPHPMIPVTSVTRDQLRDVFWAELARWHQRSDLLQALFTWQKSRYFANDFPDTWWCSAQTEGVRYFVYRRAVRHLMW
jgi:phage terminase large subunit